MRIEPGYYKGEIADYGINESRSSGVPQAFIIFRLMDEAVKGQQIIWYGGLAEEAKTPGKTAPIEFTVNTLLKCGFTGDNISTLAAGPDGNTLPLGKVMVLDIQDNTWEGKTTSRIKYINNEGESAVAGKMDFDKATAKLAGANAYLMKARAGQPAPPHSAGPQKGKFFDA